MNSKRFLPTIIIIILLLAGVFVIIGTFRLASKYEVSQESERHCEEIGRIHEVIVNDNKFRPNYVNGSLCDKLIITNKDNKKRLIAFGEHDEHKSYDGVSQKILDKDQNLEVTMNRPGSFEFHDHFDKNLVGHFEVN